jgi:hypothetical protein
LQNLMLRAKGLHTFVNNLSEVPEGALLRADNCIIDRDGIIESRRGFGIYSSELANASARAEQLLTYKNRILVHDGQRLYFDNGAGQLSQFDGTYLPTEEGLRIKYQEANGNLLFTTSTGIKKISARTANSFSTTPNYILDAGGVKGLDLRTFANYNNPGSGFLPPEKQVAYRIVWGYKDANNNLILGTPSERMVLLNTSDTIPCNVDLRITIPNEVTEDYFYQVYRTGLFDGPPDEEFNLVYEDNPSTAEIQAGLVTTTDITPDDFRQSGAFLYTNPISGQGILQTNERPPLAKDLALYRNSTFYANTQTAHKLNLTLLSVEKIKNSAISGRTITISDGEVTNTYTFSGQRAISAFVTDDFDNSTDGGFALFSSPTRRYAIYLDKNNGSTAAPSNPQTQNRLVFPVIITSGMTAQDVADEIVVEFISNPTLNQDFEASSELIVTEITTDTVANTASSSYIIMYARFNANKYILWFDKTGTNNPPTGDDTLGGIFVKVDISGDTTADEVATSLSAAINGISFGQIFTAVPSTNIVTVATARADSTLNSIFGIVGPGLGWSISMLSPIPTPEAVFAARSNGTLLGPTQMGSLPLGPIPPASDWTISFIQPGIGGAAGVNSKSVLISSLPTPAQQIDETARSFVAAINRSRDLFQVSEIETGDKIDTNPGSFIKYSAALNKRNYTIWFNITGSDSPPTDNDAQGRVFVEVNIVNDTTADEIALTLKNTLETALEDDVTVEVAGNLVTVTNREVGRAQEIDESLNTSLGAGWDLFTRVTGAREIVRASYLSSADDLPGQILLDRRDFENKPFFLFVSNDEIGASFNPTLPSSVAVSSIVAGSTTSFTLAEDLTLTPTQRIFIQDGYEQLNFPYQASYTNAVQTASDVITIPLNSSGYDFSDLPDAPIEIAVSEVISDNEVSPNRLFFSKTGQPEAVPIVNFIDVGPRDEPIERIIALRDSLFVLKTDGIYRLSGENPQSFSVSLFDDSAILLAPDTATTLNNQIYMLSTQGVATVSDTGVAVISRPIENSISRVTAADYNFKNTSFSVSSESDRAYILFLPTDSVDNVATQAFRFNSFTRTWTRWPISKLSAVVNPADDKIYLGPADVNRIEQERKNFRRQDYADRAITIAIGTGAYTGNLLKPSSIANLIVGDMLEQTQFLTIAEYNRLLRKLDLDPGIQATDFEAQLQLFSGANLTNAMTALVAKLNSVDSAVYTFDGTSNFLQIQNQFNAMVSILNSGASDSFFKNYKPSQGQKKFEGLIVGKNLLLNSVELRYQAPFIVGDLQSYRGIITDFIYAPTHMGDPSMLKQVSEATLMFEFNNFEGGKLSFRTDLDRDFEGVDFKGVGEGSFGSESFGDFSPFGGEGSQVPLRTYVPRGKQTCRFIEGRYTHKNAFNKFAVYGMSFTYRVKSNRGYR